MKKLISLIAVLALACTCCAAFAEAGIVNPIPTPIDPNGSVNCYADFSGASFKQAEDGSIVIEDVKLYSMDKYAEADVQALAEGDQIFVDGEVITIEALATDEYGVDINGGFAEDGVTLTKEEDGSYRYWGLDDSASFTEQITATLTLDKDVVFTDSADPESDEPVVANGDEALLALMQAGTPEDSEFADFTCFNTGITLTDGKVTAIEHWYMP